jgi:hypothetical protein
MNERSERSEGAAMPTFPTPNAIDLRVRAVAGEVTIEASARDDTVVEVAPMNPRSAADVEHAEATRVEHRDGVVVVEVPDVGGTWLLRRSPAVAIRVLLPEGSRAQLTTKSAGVRCRGRLGATEIKTASGDVQVEHADGLVVETASGDIRVERADGEVRVRTASGDVSVGEAGGAAQVHSASGDVAFGHAHGDVRVQTASGDTTIARAEGSVAAKTASGDAEVRAVTRGEVTFETASGDLRIGIAEGTAAWLDVQSLSGAVRSSLDDATGPIDGGETVRVRARTLSGDVLITRAS